jgi:hypothetical protein
MTAAEMTALIPGAGPPPTRIAKTLFVDIGLSLSHLSEFHCLPS